MVESTSEGGGAHERRAIVRIDAAPGGKRFQGVWLELQGARWVIDYRPREIWRVFEDAEVIVTGRTYQPFGQAIDATHFRVERMRLAAPGSRAVPYRSVGPEQLLRGTFVEQVWPAGTRRAGEAEIEFRTDLGASYRIAGGPTDRGPAAIRAREVELDPTYAATTGGPALFVLSVHPHDYTPAR